MNSVCADDKVLSETRRGGRPRRWMGSGLLLALASVGAAHVFSGSSGTLPQNNAISDPRNPRDGTWTLVWSDEFNGANGSSPDPANWVLETGGGGWGNHELQTYTNRLENAHVQNGDLVITARRETFTGTDGITRDYTSARLKTAGKFSQKYGKFEARIKIPFGQGRPIYDALLDMGKALGPDVAACPCKTIVPLYRRHVFAQIKPTTNTRVDLGFALTRYKGKLPKRLVATGGLEKKDRITHRMELKSIEEIDAELQKWLKTAYELDA